MAAINYIESTSGYNFVFVGHAVYTGNPESALHAYFAKSDHITEADFDIRDFGGALKGN